MMWMVGLVVFLLAASVPGGEKSAKMDPLLQLRAIRESLRAVDGLGKSMAGERIICIASGHVSAEALAARGARVRWQRGEFAIVMVEAGRLDEVAQTPGLRYLEAGVSSRPVTDVSIPDVGGIAARNASGLTGDGVLIGIVDSGIDWRHQDFITPEGKSRIVAILDLSEPGDYYGGTLTTADQIEEALALGLELPTHDYSGHGTHVAGIAAGDGGSSDALGSYAGMAPAAGLVIVKASRDPFVSEFSSEDQMIAIGFIDSVAAAAGKPCIINLSFGTTFGAHDGTAAVERYIDALSGPGRIFVAAAGNEADKKHHALVNPSSSGARISFTIPAYNPAAGSGNDYLLLDGWYDGGSQVAVTLITPANETIGPVGYGRYYSGSTSSGAVNIWNGFYESGEEIIGGPNPFNGDKECIIEISDAAGTPPAAGEWQLRFSGTSDKFDMWIASESMSVSFISGSSGQTTLTVPASSRSVIAVGAYTTKKSWFNIDGENLTLDTKGTIKIGDVAEFSGAGPTRDGRIKPELTAPGRIIGSTFSSEADPLSSYSVFASSNGSYPNAFILPGGMHGLSLGTSMAAPHVSGAIALLMEKYPGLSAAGARQVLIRTARPVSGTARADQWGYGKLNAAAFVSVNPDSLPEEEESTLFLPYPNPFIISTTIPYQVPSVDGYEQEPEILVYNILGQRVPARFYRQTASFGRGAVVWYGRTEREQRVAAGVYFFVFVYENRRVVRKICLLQG
ncbi:MAG TPA: S8 family serine peptidase [bacterium]|nr:S8 family serine peptidase [bacterium]